MLCLKIIHMKKSFILLVLMALLFTTCAPRSQFQTREGKAKNKHYNDIQYKKKGKWGK